MENILEKIANSLSNKLSKTFYISDRKTDLKSVFNPPIKLDPDYNYEIGLIYFSANNAIYNINNLNNKITFIPNTNTDATHQGIKQVVSGTNVDIKKIITKNNFTLKPGAYEYKRISEEIKELTNNKITLLPDLATGRSKLIVSQNVAIEFNGLQNILGFKNSYFSQGTHISENRIMIRNIHTINIDCNIANGNSYKNGEESNIIFSFPAGIQPHGHDYHIEPSTRIYFPVTRSVIDEIRIRLLDENGNLIHLDNENVSIYLHLKQI